MGNIAIVFQFISMICLLAAYIGTNYEVKQLKEKVGTYRRQGGVSSGEFIRRNVGYIEREWQD